MDENGTFTLEQGSILPSIRSMCHLIMTVPFLIILMMGLLH
ncbi:MAG: hypothetical protein CM15mP83_4130 [Flavobacteriaceae bacterium]|nr:MAG: hypothetical protein CM15mP83_4130 [Flavobacteriaceae bacterium]